MHCPLPGSQVGSKQLCAVLPAVPALLLQWLILCPLPCAVGKMAEMSFAEEQKSRVRPGSYNLSAESGYLEVTLFPGLSWGMAGDWTQSWASWMGGCTGLVRGVCVTGYCMDQLGCISRLDVRPSCIGTLADIGTQDTATQT